MKNKKILILIALVIIFVIYFIYSILINKNKTTNITASPLPISKSIQVTEKSLPLEQVLKEKNIFYSHLNNDGSLTTLSDIDTNVHYFNLASGEKRTIGSINKIGLQAVIYSPSGNRAILIQKNPELSIQFHDFTNGNIVNLNNSISHIVWSNKNENIIYYSYLDEKENVYQINYSQPDGSNWHIIAKGELVSPDFIISPDETTILSFTSNGGSKANLINTKDDKITSLDKSINMHHAYWSPDGQKIAYIDENDLLVVMDKNGTNQQKTEIKVGSFVNRYINLATEKDYMSERVIWKDNENLLLAIPIDDGSDNAPIIQPVNLYNLDIKQKKIIKYPLKDQDGINLNNVNGLYFDSKNSTLYFTASMIQFKTKID